MNNNCNKVIIRAESCPQMKGKRAVPFGSRQKKWGGGRGEIRVEVVVMIITIAVIQQPLYTEHFLYLKP